MSNKIRTGLSIDLGNSATKIVIFVSLNSEDLLSKEVIFSNDYGMLSDIDFVFKEEYGYSNESTSTIFKSGETYICNGLVAQNECRSLMRPTAMDKKYNSELSRYSIRNAYLKAYQYVSKMLGKDMDELELVFDVCLLLPLSDYEIGSEPMKQMVEEITRIDFELPNVHKEIELNSLTIRQEGLTAYIGACFGINQDSLVEEAEMMKNTIIIDIGAGTTDCLVVSQNRIIKETQTSIPIGYNSIISTLNRKLSYSITQGRLLSRQSIEYTALTGIAKLGAKRQDVSELLISVVKDIANDIATSIKEYLDSINFDYYNLEAIMLCGGGSIENQDKHEISLQYQLSQYLFEIFKNADLFTPNEDLNKRMLNALGGAVIVYQSNYL